MLPRIPIALLLPVYQQSSHTARLLLNDGKNYYFIFMIATVKT